MEYETKKISKLCDNPVIDSWVIMIFLLFIPVSTESGTNLATSLHGP